MTSTPKIPDQASIHEAVYDADRLAATQVAAAQTRPNLAFELLSQQASELLGTPVALISLVSEDIDLIYGQTGLPDILAQAGQIEAQPSFCQLTIASGKPVVIGDVRQNPTLRFFPSVAKMGVRAHLGIPLYVDGQAIGNCCVIDFKPRQWTDEDIANLTSLAAEATREFNQIPALPSDH